MISSHLQASMSSSRLLQLFSLLAVTLLPNVVEKALGKVYPLTSNIQGNKFFEEFNWHDDGDPTHGRVDYLGKEQSRAQRITFVDDKGSFILRTDSKKKIASGKDTPGRPSARIVSRKRYGEHIAVYVSFISGSPNPY